ncbi:hypothetical protein T459_23515 [Capsicum annuum]|uniref:Myb/SANT-like domain-containing protein n=1 Tax=Capsicum annuum TaxID=4072 RepID=A0A2G2YSK5_CAPAN|nr:hypothetical protein FXO37_25747 [Capsicum annuum]PHT72730.1 hypothetical protein T459_23515 [Capsicum annuum]
MMVDMPKKAKEFPSSDLKVQDNSIFIWKNTMHDTLVDTYCHEDALGHSIGGTFTTHAMDNIVKELRSKFPNKVLNKEKFHNRMKAIKRQFTKFYDTFHQSGMSRFAWDPITHKWDVEPEDVTAEHSPDEKTEDDECDHFFIFKDDIGYVYRICGVKTININNYKDLFLESSRLNKDMVALYKRCVWHLYCRYGHLTNGRFIMTMKDLSWT